MEGWIDFYDSAHTIYVSARHRDIHFLRIAEDILRIPEDIVGYIPSPSAVVLDYGCGEALHADKIAAKVGQLILVEPAPGVRSRLEARFGNQKSIEICAPDRLAALPNHSINLIVIHSVVQYLTPDELDAVLIQFHRLCKPGDGMLVIGDVILPQTSALTDAWALIKFGAREGFLFAALVGLVRTALSPYRRLRGTLGLTRYDAGAMLDMLMAAGFAATPAEKNIGHNQKRMSFLAGPDQRYRIWAGDRRIDIEGIRRRKMEAAAVGKNNNQKGRI
jgi:ubiquinone/menaquinone biosynthesis C-methylase UbiE